MQNWFAAATKRETVANIFANIAKHFCLPPPDVEGAAVICRVTHWNQQDPGSGLVKDMRC